MSNSKLLAELIPNMVAMISELGFELEEPTRVYMDSQSAIDLANNPVHHKGQSTLQSNITG